MRKRRPTVKRNIIVFLSAVLCVAALTVCLAVFRKPVHILPPETPRELAMRQSPDNAYFALVAAVKLLPKEPKPLFVAPPATPLPGKGGGSMRNRPAQRLGYQPKPGSLGDLLGVSRPDDDPEFVKYLEQCDRAIAKMREALVKPYFRIPVQWSDFTSVQSASQKDLYRELGGVTNLGLHVIARGIQLYRSGGDTTRARALLCDALRLGLLLDSDGFGYRPDAILVQRIALRQCAWVAPTLDRAAAEDLLHEILSIRDSMSPPIRNLEFYWRIMDNTGSLDRKTLSGPIRTVQNLDYMWQLSETRGAIAVHRDDMRKAAAMTYSHFKQWLRGNPGLTRSETPSFLPTYMFPTQMLEYLKLSQADLLEYYDGVAVALALDLYHRDHGEYPADLDALAPQYLKKLPNDPVSGAPLIYRREAGDYILYGVGRNGREDGQSTHRNTDDVIIHQPPVHVNEKTIRRARSTARPSTRG